MALHTEQGEGRRARGPCDWAGEEAGVQGNWATWAGRSLKRSFPLAPPGPAHKPKALCTSLRSSYYYLPLSPPQHLHTCTSPSKALRTGSLLPPPPPCTCTPVLCTPVPPLPDPLPHHTFPMSNFSPPMTNVSPPLTASGRGAGVHTRSYLQHARIRGSTIIHLQRVRGGGERGDRTSDLHLNNFHTRSYLRKTRLRWPRSSGPRVHCGDEAGWTPPLSHLPALPAALPPSLPAS